MWEPVPVCWQDCYRIFTQANPLLDYAKLRWNEKRGAGLLVVSHYSTLVQVRQEKMDLSCSPVRAVPVVLLSNTQAAGETLALPVRYPLTWEAGTLFPRSIANIEFSATFTYLMGEMGIIQTPSRLNRARRCLFPSENSGQSAILTEFAIALHFFLH